MTEFKEDNHTDYIQWEDKQRFESVDQIITYVEAMRKRISAGKYEDEQYRGNFTIFHPQTLDEEFEYLIQGLKNTALG
jgi:hypothetical protein